MDVIVEAAQPGPRLLADAGVKRAEGLVEEQDARLDRERPGRRIRCRWPPDSWDG